MIVIRKAEGVKVASWFVSPHTFVFWIAFYFYLLVSFLHLKAFGPVFIM